GGGPRAASRSETAVAALSTLVASRLLALDGEAPAAVSVRPAPTPLVAVPAGVAALGEPVRIAPIGCGTWVVVAVTSAGVTAVRAAPVPTSLPVSMTAGALLALTPAALTRLMPRLVGATAAASVLPAISTSTGETGCGISTAPAVVGPFISAGATGVALSTGAETVAVVAEAIVGVGGGLAPAGLTSAEPAVVASVVTAV